MYSICFIFYDFIDFFLKPLLDASVSCHTYAKIWFQNQYLAIQIFLNKCNQLH